MRTTKWMVMVMSLPLLVGCEEASGQCMRGGASAPLSGPMAPVEETESAPSSAASAQTAAAAPPAGPALSQATAPAAPAESAGAAAAGAAPAASAAPAAAPQQLTIEGTLTATPDRAAAHALVYLVDAPIVPTRGMKVTVDQKSMQFIPYTAAIAAGGTVTFVNSDPFPHNVFSTGPQKFNIGMLNQNQRHAVTLKEPGEYPLLCNVHPGMLGHVYVAPSSYFAISDAHGKYAIKDVPEGTYRIAAWAGKFKGDEQTVKLQGANATVDFALHK